MRAPEFNELPSAWTSSVAALSRETVQLPGGGIASLPLIRLTFTPWQGAEVAFDFGRKPLLDHKGEACFAELAMMRELRAAGWNAVWVEAYGGLRYWETMPAGWATKSDATIPAEVNTLVRAIQKAGKTAGWFDVLAWRDDRILICEAKRSRKDRLTKAQRRFIEGALSCDLAPECFLIVEWTFITPDA